jgi:predicted enzyme related to lactoylglutathione lyase
MWTRGDTPVGGLMSLPDEAKKAGAPPHWLAYIGTSNVDGSVAKATSLGAQVLVPPNDIPTVGRFAVLTDPQGAVFAMYSPSNAPAPEGPPALGDMSWHELTTTDYAAAFDFYSALFGWEKKGAMDMGPMGTYQMFGTRGRMLGGMMNKTADMPMPPNWLVYARVDDVTGVVQRVKDHGGKLLHGPVEVPGGDLIAVCMDPQGAAFAVHHVKKG